MRIINDYRDASLEQRSPTYRTDDQIVRVTVKRQCTIRFITRRSPHPRLRCNTYIYKNSRICQRPGKRRTAGSSKPSKQNEYIKTTRAPPMHTWEKITFPLSSTRYCSLLTPSLPPATMSLYFTYIRVYSSIYSWGSFWTLCIFNTHLLTRCMRNVDTRATRSRIAD